MDSSIPRLLARVIFAARSRRARPPRVKTPASETLEPRAMLSDFSCLRSSLVHHQVIGSARSVHFDHIGGPVDPRHGQHPGRMHDLPSRHF